MKVFQNLEIHGDPATVNDWLDRVTRLAVSDWLRDERRERELPDYYCFGRAASGNIPETKLYLTRERYGLNVSNVVPVGRNLNIEQYNAVIRDFYDTLAKPAADEVGVSLHMSRDSYHLEQAFPPVVLEKLRRFSDAANKSTGASHPLDRKRWLEFLVTAYRERTQIDQGTLARLLEEELGWPDDTAAELASNYQSALEILRFNDTLREDNLVPAA